MKIKGNYIPGGTKKDGTLPNKEEMNQMFDRQIESGVLFSSGMSVNMQTAVQKVCLEEILQYDEQEEKEENYF